MSEFGKIAEVHLDSAGSEAIQDHAIGDTVLFLDDVSDFDEDGGFITINGTNIAYTSTDDDASTMTLTSPLAAAVPDETEVYLYPAAAEKWASVYIEDGDDMILARIPMHLAKDLDDGVRDQDAQETCEVELRGSEWVVIDVLGLSGQGMAGLQAEANDSYIITAADVAAGVAAMPLSHRPANEWLIAFWNGVPQEPTEYTINYDAQTITWPLPAWVKAGGKLWVHYAYYAGTPSMPGGPATPDYSRISKGESPAAPVNSADGDTVILFLGVPRNETITANGFTLVAETAEVGHAGATNGPNPDLKWYYKLQVWVGVKGAAFPTINGNAGGNPWVSVGFPGSASVADSAVGTVQDSNSANTPALAGATLRCWFAISQHGYFAVPESGQVLQSSGSASDIGILVTLDTATGPVSLGLGTVEGSWAVATVAVA